MESTPPQPFSLPLHGPSRRVAPASEVSSEVGPLRYSPFQQQRYPRALAGGESRVASRAMGFRSGGGWHWSLGILVFWYFGTFCGIGLLELEVFFPPPGGGGGVVSNVEVISPLVLAKLAAWEIVSTTTESKKFHSMPIPHNATKKIPSFV